ncbi:MAG: hypothetical protein KGN36_07970 [Acidobacteriota bacterium]|nr:hypothetical protein [Acidobacteriota bacterium]
MGLATSAIGPEPSVACLAMLAGLTRWGWRVQHFRTRACLTAKEAVGQVTGMPGRHLDAWLMPPEVCRGLLARSGSSAELSVVEGTFGLGEGCGEQKHGGEGGAQEGAGAKHDKQDNGLTRARDAGLLRQS